MKKFAKMSLVAAVAVAGLSSSVSAQPLAEAIQNVNVTGSVAMKYDDRYKTTSSAQSLKGSTFKTLVNAKSKVNDDLVANVTVMSRSVDNEETNTSELVINHINLIYTGWTNTTAILGKQALDTPFTDPADPIDGADLATGYTVKYAAGPATLVAAYYASNNIKREKITDGSNNSNVTTTTADIQDNDIAYLAAMGSVAGIKLDAHYISLGNGAGSDSLDPSSFQDGGTFTKFGVSTKVSVVSLAANYATFDSDNSTGTFAEKQKTWNVSASGKAGPFGLSIKYAQNDDDGGAVALEHDAATSFQGWGIAINKIEAPQFDNKTTIAAITYPLNDSMGLKVYGGVNDYEDAAAGAGNEVDQQEIVAQFTHSLSKNFSYYVRYGQVKTDADNADEVKENRGRIYGAYKF